jgi:predicted MPP superfamily phosphohydrolase
MSSLVRWLLGRLIRKLFQETRAAPAGPAIAGPNLRHSLTSFSARPSSMLKDNAAAVPRWSLPPMPNVPTPLFADLASAAVQIILLAAQVHFFVWLRRRAIQSGSRWQAAASWLVLILGLALVASSDLLAWDRLFFSPRAPVAWRLLAGAWAAGSFGAYGCLLALGGLGAVASSRRRNKPPRAAEPGAMTRRELTGLAARLAVTAPFAAAGYGTFIGRTQFDLREVDLKIPSLPADLEGIRIAQLTDIHCGEYLSLKDLETVVGMVNETKSHLAVVTGDLITRPGDPLEGCLGRLSKIRAEAGIYHCLGNHERYCGSEDFVEEHGSSLGMEILRQRAAPLRFGKARLNLCGVDYQRTNLAYLRRGRELLAPDAFNVLLSHNPDVFPVAEGMGYDLVIAGHTHGGQVTLEIVEQWANAGLFFTPFVAGRYRSGNSLLYVSRGIGTINLPMRIGSLPEVTLLRLRRA